MGGDGEQGGGGAGEAESGSPDGVQGPAQVEVGDGDVDEAVFGEVGGHGEDAERGGACAGDDGVADCGGGAEFEQWGDGFGADFGEGAVQGFAGAGAVFAHDERGGGEFGGGQGAVQAGPGVSGWGDDDHAVAGDEADGDALGWLWGFDEADVGVAVADCFGDGEGVGDVEFEVDVGECGAQAAEPAGDEVFGDGHAGGDAECRFVLGA